MRDENKKVLTDKDITRLKIRDRKRKDMILEHNTERFLMDVRHGGNFDDWMKYCVVAPRDRSSAETLKWVKDSNLVDRTLIERSLVRIEDKPSYKMIGAVGTPEDLSEEDLDLDDDLEDEFEDKSDDEDSSDSFESRGSVKTPKKKRFRDSKIFGFFKSLIVDILVPLVTVWFVMSYVIMLAFVPTSSMEPTINSQSFVLGLRMFELNREDIIVFESPVDFPDYNGISGTLLVKRIIGMPGDHIEISDGDVFVNGTELSENYLQFSMEFPDANWEVPQDCYFVMGDNRNNSYDSRYWEDPFVPMENIKSKVFFISPSISKIQEVINGLF